MDRFSAIPEQEKLAGFIVAFIVAKAFKMRLETESDWREVLCRVVTIPGNHDEIRTDPPLRTYHETLTSVLADILERELSQHGVSYREIRSLLREKVVLLSNPSVDVKNGIGLLHEYSGSAEQSTYKTQKASKQFLVLSRQTNCLLMANHHEENFLILRVGNRTIQLCHLGTMKRFYSFESKRSKISEFGVAVIKDKWIDDQLVSTTVKFIPSVIDFDMQKGEEYQEKNRLRGIKYAEILKNYETKGELPEL